IELGMVAQHLRQQDAATAVQLQVGGITDEDALELAGIRMDARHGFNLLLDLLPRIDGIEQKALGHGIDRGNEATGILADQLVTIARWHGHAPLRIQIDCADAPEHSRFLRHRDRKGRLNAARIPTFLQKYPLFATLRHYRHSHDPAQALFGVFRGVSSRKCVYKSGSYVTKRKELQMMDRNIKPLTRTVKVVC